MFKKIPLFAVIIIVLVAVTVTFQTTYVVSYKNFSRATAEIAGKGAEIEENKELSEKVADKVAELDKCYRTNYYGEVSDVDDLVDWAAIGYVFGTGDRYGEYMNPETYKAFQEESTGESVGIGILVANDISSGAIEIVNVMPDSPASKADLKIGDLIYKVGDETAADLGYNETLSKMRGDAGTTAEFTVLRDGREIEFSIVRDKYTSVSVMAHMYEDGKTAVVRILEFDETTYPQFTQAMDSMQKQGAERYVFDLRNNPGGMLGSITSVLDALLPKGPIIRIVDKNGSVLQTVSSDEREFEAPMAVLANSNTASAAELFTAAMRDYNKAKIIGTNTYGKGSMQTIVNFKDGSALKLTVAHYLPPFSDGYDGEGIAPDVEVNMPEDKAKISLYLLEDADDDQLLKAIEVLNENN